MQVYEEHLPDSFAAMLDMGSADAGPVVYFYCLSNPEASPADASYNAFAAAHHVVLDSSVPFSVVEVSLTAEPAQCEAASAHMCAPVATEPKTLEPLQSFTTRDTNTTNGTSSTRMTMHADVGSPDSWQEDDTFDIVSMSHT